MIIIVQQLVDRQESNLQRFWWLINHFSDFSSRSSENVFLIFVIIVIISYNDQKDWEQKHVCLHGSSTSMLNDILNEKSTVSLTAPDCSFNSHTLMSLTLEFLCLQTATRKSYSMWHIKGTMSLAVGKYSIDSSLAVNRTNTKCSCY